MAGKEVVYAFIDASNIIYGARSEGWFIDQKKLFVYLKNKFQDGQKCSATKLEYHWKI